MAGNISTVRGTAPGPALTAPVPAPVDCCVDTDQLRPRVKTQRASLGRIVGAPANPHRPPVTAAWRISSTASRSTRQEPSRPRLPVPRASCPGCGFPCSSGADVVVEALGFDANLGFQPGQWVELSDDSYLFGPTPNRPESVPNQSINAEQRTLTMTAAVTGGSLATRNFAPLGAVRGTSAIHPRSCVGCRLLARSGERRPGSLCPGGSTQGTIG